MAALTTNRNRLARSTCRLLAYPVAASTTIYKGALVALDANGFAVNAADTAGLQVVGVAAEKVDNAGGANGDKKIVIEAEREYLFAASSITQAMVGDVMYVVDNDTVDDAAGPTNDVAVGRLTEFISTTQGWVYIPGLTATP